MPVNFAERGQRALRTLPSLILLWLELIVMQRTLNLTVDRRLLTLSHVFVYNINRIQPSDAAEFHSYKRHVPWASGTGAQ